MKAMHREIVLLSPVEMGQGLLAGESGCLGGADLTSWVGLPSGWLVGHMEAQLVTQELFFLKKSIEKENRSEQQSQGTRIWKSSSGFVLRTSNWKFLLLSVSRKRFWKQICISMKTSRS